MERLLKRLLQRLLIIGLGVVSIWLIVFVVFRFADHRAGKLVAHDRGFRPQFAICDRAVQHALSVRTWSGHRLPEGDRSSPRKRHHIRFWALALAHAEETVGTSAFWQSTDRPPEDARVLWVGAGTKDTGISLTRLTFQVTHATADDTNAEREYIIAELSKHRVIEDVTSYEAGQHLPVGRVNHYIADGDVSVANLMVEAI